MRDATKNAAAVVDTIKALSHSTDSELGAVVGITAQGVNKALRKAREGSADLSIEMLVQWAQAFDLPAEIFLWDHQRALLWIAENRPNLSLRVDLTEPKSGPDDPKHRSGWHVRTGPNALGRLTHFLHLADEPAQMIDLR